MKPSRDAELKSCYEALAGTHSAAVRMLLQLARTEDLGPAGFEGDLTGLVTIEPGATGRASLVFRSGGIAAGLRVVPELLHVFESDLAFTARTEDGDSLAAGTVAAELQGNMRQLLAVERTLLNLIGRLSGIATRTAEFVRAVDGTPAKILDTRKTTPGLRALEKYAVRCGGGHNHRIGLFDAVLIKDNHLAGLSPREVAATVTRASKRAVEIAAARGQPVQFIECEVDQLDQLQAILDAGGCGVGIVLLDNMSPETMRRAVALRDRSGLRIQLEASGGVTLQTVRGIADTGVDRISIGGLTHQAVSLDVALDVL